MAENSGIAWTTHTFNPWRGCTKVSEGCSACYAEALDARWAPKGNGGIAPHWGPGAPRQRTTVAIWNKVLRWNREAAHSTEPVWVFCASMADVFDNEVDSAWRGDLWTLLAQCRNLNFQILTKRIGNVPKMLPSFWARDFRHCGIVSTVVTQEECDRDLPKLKRLKSEHGVAWVGLSIEPQLECVLPKIAWDTGCGDALDWVITGGESDQAGSKGRPYDPDWARVLLHAGPRIGYRVFVKQMGSNPVGLKLKDRAGADPSEWPLHLRVREFPKLPATVA